MKRLTLFPVAAAAVSALLAGAALLATCAQAASTLPTVTFALNSSSIEIGGALQSGAVNVAVTDSGVKEASAILFQLKPGVSVAEVEAFLSSKAEKEVNNADRYGSIVLDAEAAPGATSEAQTVLQPGQYVAMYAAGEGPPKAPTSFTVTAAAAPAALPAAQATERSIEFGFTGPATLRDGELVRFENEGFLVHMDVALQTKSESSARKLVKLMLAGREKQANKLVTGYVQFAGPLSTGAYQQETISAKPGVYVQACFMDTQDGRSHTQLGMERIIHITH